MNQQLNFAQALNPKNRFDGLDKTTNETKHFIVKYVRKYFQGNELTIAETDSNFNETGEPFKIMADSLTKKYELSKMKGKISSWTDLTFMSLYKSYDPQNLEGFETYPDHQSRKMASFINKHSTDRGFNKYLKTYEKAAKEAMMTEDVMTSLQNGGIKTFRSIAHKGYSVDVYDTINILRERFKI